MNLAELVDASRVGVAGLGPQKEELRSSFLRNRRSTPTRDASTNSARIISRGPPMPPRMFGTTGVARASLCSGRRPGYTPAMNYAAINLQQKFGLFSEHWQPKVVAEMNDYQFKVVKIQGDFVWHDHQDTDETFLVLEGDLRIDFRDGAVHVGAGEMFVPQGRRAQALRRTRGEDAPDRAARRPQHGSRGR